MNVKITVVVPFYNEEKYLSEAIESVMSQTLKEVELICVDDGSTDSSVKIVKEFQKEHDNIVLLHQDNQGPGEARNKAIDVARGEYICFLDADDYYYSREALETLYLFAARKQLLACAGVGYTNYSGEVKIDSYFSGLLKDNKPTRMTYHEYQNDYYYTYFIFKLDLIREKKIRFPNLRRYQDPPFLMEVLYYAEQFYILPVGLYVYRRGEKTMIFSKEKVNDLIRGILYNLVFAKEHNLEKLYALLINRVNKDYFNYIFESLSKDNMIALSLLIDMNRTVKNTGHKIQPLEYFFYLKEKVGYQYKEEFILDNEALDLIPKGADILLYGAGKECERIIKNYKDSPHFFIIAVVDKFKTGKVDGYKIIGIDDISYFRYDYIYITVKDKNLSEDIKEELLNAGIKKDRIIKRK